MWRTKFKNLLDYESCISSSRKETRNFPWEKEANKAPCLVKEGLWNFNVKWKIRNLHSSKNYEYEYK